VLAQGLREPSLHGDSHNFGNRVCLINKSGIDWYFKPRTLFWEQLFFGDNSTFKNISDGSRFFGEVFPFFKLSFHSETNLENGWSRPVNEVDAQAGLPGEMAFQFGSLLAYCFTFGIMDLHEGNVVLTPEGLQIIDVEVVGSKMSLPHETLLLPFKDVTEEFCAFVKLWDLRQNMPIEKSFKILEGYIYGCEFLLNINHEIISRFNQIIKLNPFVPVRVILRDTEKYRKLKYEEFDPPLIPEEKIQLDRGDIPYFFKYFNDNNLYYLTSKDREKGIVSITSSLKSRSDQVAQPPEILLSKKRLENDIFAAGAMYLIRRLFGKEEILSKEVGNYLIAADLDTISIKTPTTKFKCTRVRAPNL